MVRVPAARGPVDRDLTGRVRDEVGAGIARVGRRDRVVRVETSRTRPGRCCPPGNRASRGCSRSARPRCRRARGPEAAQVGRGGGRRIDQLTVVDGRGRADHARRHLGSAHLRGRLRPRLLHGRVVAAAADERQRALEVITRARIIIVRPPGALSVRRRRPLEQRPDLRLDPRPRVRADGVRLLVVRPLRLVDVRVERVQARSRTPGRSSRASRSRGRRGRPSRRRRPSRGRADTAGRAPSTGPAGLSASCPRSAFGGRVRAVVARRGRATDRARPARSIDSPPADVDDRDLRLQIGLVLARHEGHPDPSCTPWRVGKSAGRDARCGTRGSDVEEEACAC